MSDQYEFVYDEESYFGETLNRWEFCEGGTGEYTSNERMLKLWLRKALGLPERYVVEVKSPL